MDSIRVARVRKGLSQRELSARSGVPQSHISKIESGGVDLRVSSLIVLARALDLELFVAPKKSVPAIKSIIRSSQGINDESRPVLGLGFKDSLGGLHSQVVYLRRPLKNLN